MPAMMVAVVLGQRGRGGHRGKDQTRPEGEQDSLHYRTSLAAPPGSAHLVIARLVVRRIGERNLTRLVAVALLVLGVSAAGCGGGVSSNSVTRSSSSTTGGGSTNAASASADFGWLRPGPAPADWRSAQISTGAVLYYPPTWRQSVSDPGTASAALHDQRDRFLGYLNLTPRQGNESLSNWGSFRVEHRRFVGASRESLRATLR